MNRSWSTYFTRPLGILIAYLIVGGCWIAFSDQITLSMGADPQQIIWLQTLKGWGFVVASGVLIYVLMRQGYRRVQREREFLQKLFDTIPVMITVYDPARGDVQVNREFERVAGWSSEDAQRINLMEKCYPDPEDRAEAAAFMQSPSGEWRDFSLTTRDGSVVESSWTNFNLSDDTRIGVGIDISGRKERERQLRAVNERLEAVIEASPDAIIVLDLDRKVMLWNPAAERIFGWSADEVVGNSVPFVPPAKEQEFAALHQRVADGATVTDVEITRSRKDGTSVELTLAAAPLRDAEGDVVGIMSILENISAQKEAERQLSRLIDNVPGLVYRMKNQPTWPTEFISDGVREISGYAPEALERGEIHWGEDVVAADYNRRIWTRVQEALDERRPFKLTYPIETAAGERRWVDEQGHGVFAADGSVEALEGVMIDVTERVRILHENERFNAELQTLVEVSQKMTEQLDLEVVNQRIVEGIVATISRAEAASLWMREADRAAPVAWIGYEDALMKDVSRPANSSLLGATLERTEPLIVDDAHQFERFEHWGIVPLDAVRSVMGVPIVIQNEPVGVLFVDNFSETDVFDERDGRLLQSLAAQASVAIQNAELVDDLRQLSVRLLEAEENEQRRIAQELHDEVGGLLTSLQLCLDTARRHLSADGETAGEQALRVAQEELQEAEQLTDVLSDQVRQLSLNLRPRVLDDLGLAAALGDLAERKQKHSGVHVQLHCEVGTEQRFSDRIETVAYRIVQEALTNAVRHAEVDTVQVLVNVLEDRLRLHVIDEGTGFSRTSLDDRHKMGLSGMRERVELLGGSLAIDTAPGEGTRISATLPLR